MGANNPAQRPVRRPPSDLAALELPQTRQIARTWFRVHPAIYPAIRFSLLARHRFSHPDCPNKLLYLAMDAETCFWECFGDDMFDNGRVLAKTHWDDSSISKVMVPPLHLCDLSNTSTRSAITVDLTALMSADLAIPQEWGLAIQKHPARVPAIKFKSRFTGTACLAIFDRVPLPAQLEEQCLGPLSQYGPALSWLAKNNAFLI